MRRKPEKTVNLYMFKCLVTDCLKPWGLAMTMRSEAEMNWYYHAMSQHLGKITDIPPYIIREKKYRLVKD